MPDAMRVYEQNPNVAYLEPDYLIQAPEIAPNTSLVISTSKVTPNDTYYNLLWGQYNTGQSNGTAGVDIDDPDAWNITT